MLTVNCILQYDIGNTTPGIEDVKVVIGVFEVFSEANFVLLDEFVHGWVNNSNN